MFLTIFLAVFLAVFWAVSLATMSDAESTMLLKVFLYPLYCCAPWYRAERAEKKLVEERSKCRKTTNIPALSMSDDKPLPDGPKLLQEFIKRDQWLKARRAAQGLR